VSRWWIAEREASTAQHPHNTHRARKEKALQKFGEVQVGRYIQYRISVILSGTLGLSPPPAGARSCHNPKTKTTAKARKRVREGCGWWSQNLLARSAFCGFCDSAHDPFVLNTITENAF
jgi:hypothetical protein